MNKSVTIKQVEMITKRKIVELLAIAGENKKCLAELRRGIGKTPGEIPQLMGYFLESIPESFYGYKEPSRAEWAVYISLTLFALHQQGKEPATNPMHIDGQAFGKAMADLITGDDNKKSVTRRFNRILTSGSMEELAHYLRNAVQLLRREDIGLDYAKLAGEIYRFQFPEMVTDIRLEWGQDFYRESVNKSKSLGR